MTSRAASSASFDELICLLFDLKRPKYCHCNPTAISVVLTNMGGTLKAINGRKPSVVDLGKALSKSPLKAIFVPVPIRVPRPPIDDAYETPR